MSHLVGAFLEMMSAERGAAANTIAAYRRDLTSYAGFVAGKKQTLLDCPRETVNAYLDGLKAEGLSASSSARHLSAIRQFHKFLCADGMRGDDPTRIVASPKTRRPLPKVLSVAEVDRLLMAAEQEAGKPAKPAKEESARRTYCLLELLYATGLRVSELVALKRNAVMREGSFITVTGKGNKDRVVPMNDRARDAVRAWAETLPKDATWLFPAKGKAGIWSGRFLRGTSKRWRKLPEFRWPASRRTSCAMPLRATFSRVAPTCVSCRCCSGMPIFRPRRFIPMCWMKNCAIWWKRTIRWPVDRVEPVGTGGNPTHFLSET